MAATPFEKYSAMMAYIRQTFQWIGQDIFVENYQRSKLANFITMNWCFVIISLLSTAYDANHYPRPIRIAVIAFAVGAVHVCIHWIKYNTIIINRHNYK